MNCLILAAGYATRLYPLTLNSPKPLLKVKNKTILDWLVDDISKNESVNKFIIVSNHKFASNFEKWAKSKNSKKEIIVLDDGTSTNETRLGAVMDILFAIEKLNLDDDLMVIAGDNVLDFSLCKLIEYYNEKKSSCIMRYFEEDINKCRSCGIVTVANDDKITSMEEKPQNPKSQWTTPPFYIYKKDDVKKIPDAINNGCKKDAPGSFAAWLSNNETVYAMEMPGKRYDIGNLESYENVQKIYNGIKY